MKPETKGHVLYDFINEMYRTGNPQGHKSDQ